MSKINGRMAFVTRFNDMAGMWRCCFMASYGMRKLHDSMAMTRLSTVGIARFLASGDAEFGLAGNTRAVEAAVSARILGEILLVIFLGVVEDRRRQHFR